MPYQVKEPLKFDGEEFGVGDTVDMTAKQAAPLIEIGVLEEGAATGAPPSTAAPEDDAPRIAAIKDAIQTLDTANKSLWLKDGRPDTKAITVMTGWPVSAADRDTAWAELQA